MAFPAVMPAAGVTHVEGGTTFVVNPAGTRWVIQAPPPTIPPHNPAVAYVSGQTVTQGGNTYIAPAAVGAGAFSAANWNSLGGGVVMAAAVPTIPPPTNGLLWYNLTTSHLYIYRTDITAWVEIS
jgi:hypothetical protein